MTQKKKSKSYNRCMKKCREDIDEADWVKVVSLGLAIPKRELNCDMRCN